MLAYVIGALATAQSSDAASIGAVRALCGIGSGAVMAAANAAAASQASFDALMSRAIAGSTLVAFVLYMIVPAVREWQGPGASFLTLGACGVVFFTPAGYLSRGRRVASAASLRSHAP